MISKTLENSLAEELLKIQHGYMTTDKVKYWYLKSNEKQIILDAIVRIIRNEQTSDHDKLSDILNVINRIPRSHTMRSIV